MAGPNRIEIQAQWRDQGVKEGLTQTARSVQLLTSAIGTAAGLGAIGAAGVLGRRLGELARAPFELAVSFAKFTATLKAGTKEMQELSTMVGGDGVESFLRLSSAQQEADKAWREFTANVAAKTAPTVENFLKVETGALNAANAVARFMGGGSTYTGGAYRGGSGVAPGGINPIIAFRGASGSSYLPREGTAGEQAYAAKIQAEWEAARAIAESIKDVRSLALFLAQQPGASLGFAEARGVGPTNLGDPATQIYGRHGLKDQIQETKEASTGLENQLLSAAQNIAGGFASAVTGFVTGVRSLGEAARSFIASLVEEILGMLARIGGQFALGGLLNFASSFLPAGNVIGKIAKSINPFRAAGAGGGGTTVVFQGINTRDAYMSYQRGELGKAQDLQRLRAEVG